MEEETIRTAIELASPGTRILFSVLGAAVTLGAVTILVVAAVSIVRALRERREDDERRRAKAERLRESLRR